MLRGKHIILGITGGIAAYKSASLLRLLVKEGAEVQVIMTPSGREFITPVTLSALSGKPVITDFFSANTGEWHSHVDLGIWADLMIIAPATASTIGKMANGVADNMLLTTYFSAKEHVMIAPAMDLDMYAHPATQRNLQRLREDGVGIIDAASGELASHLIGKGRMEEPEVILKEIKRYFYQSGELKGKKVLVTAGPTYEKIDPVRFVGNYSSGKMGYAIAAEFASRGADVTLVSGPVSLDTPIGVRRVDVENAEQMLESCLNVFDDCDIAVMSAAVADYAPAQYHDQKLKRENKDTLTIEMKRNPDIAAMLGKIKGNRILIGFALESNDERENALSKLKRKNLDFIVLNSLRDKGACFMTDNNKITIIAGTGEVMEYPLKPKKEVARDIVDVVTSGLADV